MTATRFAPSPTGLLHLGHAYSALVARDVAREVGGAYLLRIDDLDSGRVRGDYRAGIDRDLAWLEMTPDAPPMVQSERVADYAEALDRLKAAGLAYPCFCTRAEIVASVSAPHGPDGPVYPGTCRGMEAGPASARIAAGEDHAWRLDMGRAAQLPPMLAWGGGERSETGGPRAQRASGLSARAKARFASHPPRPLRGHPPIFDGRGVLTWHDRHAGPVIADPAPFGDIVLARRDGAFAYHLASTIDDAAQGISHVVRGADLFAATHIHRLLQALLGLPTPAYVHHRLIADLGGKRLAKRHDAASIASLRAAGMEPELLIDNLRQGVLPLGYRWLDA